jgi:transcriptional regulator with XRE-family HTH domain
VSRGAVSQWESGTTEPSAANLRSVAVETGVNYEWLATGRGEPINIWTIKKYYDALPHFTGDLLARAGGGLIICGAIEAGAFRPMEPLHLPPQRETVPPDPRYPHVRQYAWHVRDNSAAAESITQGMLVIGALHGEFTKVYEAIRDRSLVIVERARPATMERELTIRRLSVLPSGRDLLSPTGQDVWRVTEGGNEAADSKEIIQISAVALAAIRQFSA